MPPPTPPKRFPPNLAPAGRLIRAAAGVALLGAAPFAWTLHPALGVAAAVPGAFLLFEAARGWCVLRACRIRTPF